MEQRHKEAQEWLSKGWHDLLSARVLFGHEPVVTDTAAFHCQQAVEKVLKAFLVFHGCPFARVHNLGYLVDMCVEIDASCEQLRNAGEVLTPYGVEIRYPGEIEDVSTEQVAEGLRCAEYAWGFVLARMPADVTQQWHERESSMKSPELPRVKNGDAEDISPSRRASII